MAEERTDRANPFTLFLILILLILSFPDDNPIKKSLRNLIFGKPQTSDENLQGDENSQAATASTSAYVPAWRYNWKVSEGGARQ